MDQHAQLIVKLFFDLDNRNAEGKIFCRCCEHYFKDNKGFFMSLVIVLHLSVNYICVLQDIQI